MVKYWLSSIECYEGSVLHHYVRISTVSLLIIFLDFFLRLTGRLIIRAEIEGLSS
jgi:hypothetical protein